MYREQDITNYTLVSLQQAFFIFIGLILLHGVAIFTLKMNLSNHFKEADWLNKIGHVVESLNVPEVYKDFDVDLNPDWERTPYDYKLSYDSVQKETFWMTFLQMVFNFLLLVPLLVTASKVMEKHSALVDNIGTYDEEDEAYELLNSLSQFLPFIFMITAVFEVLLAAAYLKWFHPWKIILQEAPNNWETEMDDKEAALEDVDQVTIFPQSLN